MEVAANQKKNNPHVYVRAFQTLFVQAELLVELVDASAGVNQFLLARVKGVTLRADFHFDILLRASRFNNLAASAPDRRLLIVGMDPFLHRVHLFRFFPY
jgi:hypothetical protein